jgi:hypothetical protein
MSLSEAFDSPLVKNIQQAFPYKPYQVGKCGCKKKNKNLKCREGDFEYERVQCFDGSESIICSQIDPNACPDIGNVKGRPLIIDTEEEQIGSDVSQNGRNITCIYGEELRQSDTALTDYTLAFGQDEDFALLAQNLCFTTSRMCPEDPLSGAPMPLCSRFVSETTDGELCRQEATKPANSTIYEQRMETYCSQESTPDCRCIDRVNTLVYDALKTNSDLTDGCWWRWCADANRFLVPPKIDETTDPTTCESVRKEIARKINQNVDTLECCQLQNNVIYSPDGIQDLPINCTFLEALRINESWFDQYGWWLIAFFSVFIIIIAFVAIWGIYFSRS